jgi:uncharacterized membrane protein YcaP (DUF421 family)
MIFALSQAAIAFILISLLRKQASEAADKKTVLMLKVAIALTIAALFGTLASWASLKSDVDFLMSRGSRK